MRITSGTKTSFSLLLLLWLSPSCSKHDSSPRATYDLKGEVIALDTANNAVTIDHEQIPGFMKAMTMRFQVRGKQSLQGVEVGDSIQSTLSVSDSGVWVEGIRVTARAK